MCKEKFPRSDLLKRHTLKVHASEGPQRITASEKVTVKSNGYTHTNHSLVNSKVDASVAFLTHSLPENPMTVKCSMHDEVKDMLTQTTDICKRLEASFNDRPETQSILFDNRLRSKLINCIRSNENIDSELAEEMNVPSSKSLSRYMKSMFLDTILYMPCIHRESFDVETAPLPLLLSLLSYGCLVCDGENDFQIISFHIVEQLLNPQENKMWMLQTYIMWLNMGAWSAKPKTIKTVMVKQTEMLFLQQKLIATLDITETLTDFHGWKEKQDLIRCTITAFTISCLVSYVYNIQIHGIFGMDIPLPCTECIYHTSEADWNDKMVKSHPMTLYEFLKVLLDEEQELTFDFYHGDFICHTLITWLTCQIGRLQELSVQDQEIGMVLREKYIKSLDRWDFLRASDYNFKLFYTMKFQYGAPMAFNSIALLRIGYIMLASDFRTIGSTFMLSEEPEPVVKAILLLKPIKRNKFATRAAQVSCQALRASVAILSSFETSKSAVWIWSIQHSISNLYCAIFLTAWLSSLPAEVSHMSDEENDILKFILETLDLAPEGKQKYGHLSLSGQVAALWAQLFADNAMWGIQIRVSQVLFIYSTKL